MIIITILLSSCASNKSRYILTADKAPRTALTLTYIEDAQPRYEPSSQAGNRNYSVLGQNYEVLTAPYGFSETGMASWYGEKFHGYKTANGEIYDMYSMSAAHKSLPLPSYVEVENTNNGKKTIVRVNDRGPFYKGRVIDLSYAAALKLDILRTGTALVKVTLFTVDKPSGNTECQRACLNRYFVQLASLSDRSKAMRAAAIFSKRFDLPSDINQSGDVYRIRLGPFYNYVQTQNVVITVRQHKIKEAFIVTEPIADKRSKK
ncbi:septal ring lytic transglycosylase RlpA family protein [Candidatus Enterovibrio escicola]|nr:septal ring lytic transglycosylase RlpA family protein [Candidatus Enterovibrio escacola]